LLLPQFVYSLDLDDNTIGKIAELRGKLREERKQLQTYEDIQKSEIKGLDIINPIAYFRKFNANIQIGGQREKVNTTYSELLSILKEKNVPLELDSQLDEIDRKATTWTANYNPIFLKDEEYKKKLLGALQEIPRENPATGAGITTTTQPTLYEYYNTGDDGSMAFGGKYWLAQTFTVSSTSHTVTSVKVKLFKWAGASPGTVTVSIRATDGAGDPTGPDLTSGTTSGDTLPVGSWTNAVWREITLMEYTLSASTKYAIVIRDSGVVNDIGWNYDTSSPSYGGGNRVDSSTSGTTWTFRDTSTDFMFEIWGNPLNNPSSTTSPTIKPITTTTEIVFCAGDVKLCPDGSYVGRNPNDNCQFYPCPNTTTTTTLPTTTTTTIPSMELDWRNYNNQNYITPVKNQGGCGSCVAFGAVAALEGNLKVGTNNPSWNPDLSEQHLFSCGGGKCALGWYLSAALNYLKVNGTPDEPCFPYTGSDSLCSNTCSNWQSRAYKINWYWVSTSTDAIKAALKNGPLLARFDVYSDFFSYRSGIYRHTTGSLAGGHAIAIVGYGTYNGETYWIVKNSWGSSWGEAGYFRIFSGDCGINQWVAAMYLTNNPPQISSFTADKSSPQPLGVTIGLTCSASDPETDPIYYQFQVRWNGGTWNLLRDWSTTSTTSYGTTSAGTLDFKCLVRDGKHSAGADVEKTIDGFIITSPTTTSSTTTSTSTTIPPQCSIPSSASCIANISCVCSVTNCQNGWLRARLPDNTEFNKYFTSGGVTFNSGFVKGIANAYISCIDDGKEYSFKINVI
jgi:hypothetical protein